MKAKPKPKAAEIEELPDAWERFERAFDTVMKAKPMPQKGPKRDGSSAAKKRGRPAKPRQ